MQAKLGLDPQIVSTRLELVANSLLPQVFEDATNDLAGRGGSLPKLVKTLTFSNGTATLTSDVLTGLSSDSVLYDPTDTTKIYAYVPEWEDFVGDSDVRLGRFTVRNNRTVYVVEPGEIYENGDGLDGDLTLVIAGVPAVPATASTAIDAPQEFVNKAVEMLAERLRGLLPEK